MPDRLMGVYKIRNTITGTVDVSSSSDITKRWRAHRLHSTTSRCITSPNSVGAAAASLQLLSWRPSSPANAPPQVPRNWALRCAAWPQ